MTDKLPGPLLALFSPRPPIRYFPPIDYPPGERRTNFITPIGQLVTELRKTKTNSPETDDFSNSTAISKKPSRKESRIQQDKQRIAEETKLWNPNLDAKIHGDPFKTLFVTRLSYSTDESDLTRIFGRYGPIESIRLVKDINTQKPKGYAFIVFRHERDMKIAYRECNGLRLHDRCILVDVERGRTVRSWRPARLGGGLGSRHYTKMSSHRDQNYHHHHNRDHARRGGGKRYESDYKNHDVSKRRKYDR